jgi:hypothetical protein
VIDLMRLAPSWAVHWPYFHMAHSAMAFVVSLAFGKSFCERPALLESEDQKPVLIDFWIQGATAEFFLVNPRLWHAKIKAVRCLSLSRVN